MKRIDNTTSPLHQVCIDVVIKNDEVYRGNREFFSVLKVLDPNIPVKNNVTKITILDDDG